MDYDRNVYILGAGFSRDAGIPMIAQFMFVMRDCIPWLKAQSRNGEAAAVERVFDFRRQAASAAERVNLNAENVEELFSLASATKNQELSKDVTVAIAATIDFAATRDPIAERNAKIAQGTQIDEQWKVQNPQSSMTLPNGQPARRYLVPAYDVYHLLMAGYPEEWLEERSDAIITFNYDLLPEASLSRLRIPFNYNSGEIVGFFRVAVIPGLNIDQGFLLDKRGAFTTINVPGAFHTQALGINALGKIVGAFNDSKGVHGFLATR